MPKTVKEVAKTKTEPKKVNKMTFYQAVGRRKDATANVRLYVCDTHKSLTLENVEIKPGDIVVNSRQVNKYFNGAVAEKIYLEPFRTTNTMGRFAVSVKINGGGLAGQLGAFVHGVSRALLLVDNEKFRPILKKKGFLTRDARIKERRKAGFAQKARARKQSPKR